MGVTAEPGQPLSPAVPQENGRRQKQHLGLRFDSLCSILEERKKELLQSIAREQEEKVQRVRGLIRQYGDHLEASSKLVESAIQAMEEPQMAVYLQVCVGGECGARTLRGAGAAPRCAGEQEVQVPPRGLGLPHRAGGGSQSQCVTPEALGPLWDVLGWGCGRAVSGSWGPRSCCSRKILTLRPVIHSTPRSS